MLPVYVQRPELTRDLARNDVVRLYYEIRSRPDRPVHLELKDVELRWVQGNTWAGAAKVVLRFGKTYELGAGFGIKNGEFDHANSFLPDPDQTRADTEDLQHP